MMNAKLYIISICLLFSNFCMQAMTGNPAFDWNDYAVVWQSQSKDASASMPLGGGDIGCNVWVEKGNILLYAQRSGSLSENGEYLKLGRLRISFTPDIFALDTTFCQMLNLEDGSVYIYAGPKKEHCIHIWVDRYTHSIQFDVQTSMLTDVKVAYENWRIEDKLLLDKKKGRFGCFALEGYPGDVIKLKDQVSFVENKVLFYHQNPSQTLSPDLMLAQQGLTEYADQIVNKNRNRITGGILGGKGFIEDGQETGIYQVTPYRAWCIKSEKPAKKHTFQWVTYIEQEEETDQWISRLNKLYDQALKEKGNWKRNKDWWSALWKRSWIITDPKKKEDDPRMWQMGRNYQLMRYQLATNFEGEFPSKFNGGNYTFDPFLVDSGYKHDPDWRAWGGDVFTAQNQRLLYWPLLKSGDTEGMHSQFNLYKWGLAGASLKAQKHFGHQGALFCEYASASGLDFGSGWGWENSSLRSRGREIQFGDTLADATKGYGEVVEHGLMASPHVSYHWESQVEHAYMILEYYRYTGKSIKEYIPFIQAALRFFDEHYQKRALMRTGKPLDADGKLILYPSTSCESYRGAYDPADLLSGLYASIEALLSTGQTYLTKEEYTYFEGFLGRLPQLTWGKVGEDTVLLPARSYKKYQNVECPQFYPLFPFNRYSIDSPEIPFFRNTWKHGTFPKNMVMSWHQDGIFFARMGMIEEALEYNKSKLADSPRRFPTFWGPGHDWVPDHNWGGSGMIGLQEMLLQTTGDMIYLFPCWPKDKDVYFKLHAPHNTTIEVEYVDGVLQKLEVTPQSRRKDVVNKLGNI